MRVTSFLFDLDGTLVDSYPGIEHSSRVAVESVLPGRTLEDWRERIGPPIREIFRRAFPDISPATLDDLERRFRSSYDGEGWKKSVLYGGVQETLRNLTASGVRCFVVTNKPRIPAVRILEQLGLKDYFEAIVARDSQNPPFPSKEGMVRFLLTQFHLHAETTLMVGDSKEDGMAAQACGLKFVAVAYGYGEVEAMKEFSVSPVLYKISDVMPMIS